jgi:hypothetical protein
VGLSAFACACVCECVCLAVWQVWVSDLGYTSVSYDKKLSASLQLSIQASRAAQGRCIPGLAVGCCRPLLLAKVVVMLLLRLRHHAAEGQISLCGLLTAEFSTSCRW